MISKFQNIKITQIQDEPTPQSLVSIDTDGNLYKSATTGGGAGSGNIDGGFANSIYCRSFEGGFANCIYLATQKIDGGAA